MRIALSFALLAAAFACALLATPALAQRDRVFVASYGSDSNPCTFGSPCKTFQQAVNVVAVGGEVTAIDSAGFGAITISHAVTITSPNGVEAGIVAGPSGTAITINAEPSDIITLNGLTLDGHGVNGSNGVQFNTGGALHVENCVLRNFLYGIDFLPTASGTLSVSNTLVSDILANGGGIEIEEIGSGTVIAALDHVDIESALGDGLDVISLSGPVNVTVENSTIANGGNNGIAVVATAGNPLTIVVRNSTIANNGAQNVNAVGFVATGSGAQGWVTRSTVTGNPVGLFAYTGAAIYSYGDNNFVNNGSSNRASSIIGYQ